MDDRFNIPVVLFFFTREDLILKVLEQVAKVRPKKLYLFSDGGRNDEEWELVYHCREAVENRIDWDCDIIRNYSDKNRGVYESIGKGAIWVFEKEEQAIFLEDDNLPEISFFRYCKELLEKYNNDSRILWVCGTNYLEEYTPSDKSSYMFTKHLLPCGWASWSHKFLEFYDGELNGLDDEGISEKLKYAYEDKTLFKQQFYNFKKTYSRMRKNKSVSWDHQMCFSIRSNNLFGISPINNQIKNIGVDERSTHGGTSMSKVMTKRFCGMNSKRVEYPLKHPKVVMVDPEYEKRIGKLILYPLRYRMLFKLIRIIKPILGFSEYENVTLKK